MGEREKSSFGQGGKGSISPEKTKKQTLLNNQSGVRERRIRADQGGEGVSSPERPKKALYNNQPGVKERDKIDIYEQKRCEEKVGWKNSQPMSRAAGRVVTI